MKKYYQDNKRNEELMDNKFPGKDITQEDLKTKFPLASSNNKKKIIKIDSALVLEIIKQFQSLQVLMELKIKI